MLAISQILTQEFESKNLSIKLLMMQADWS